MVQGKLEVLLVSAKGLENADFLFNIDPYAILTCRSQEQKSSVASGKGSNPEWNETFIFTVSGSAPELTIKLMDKDTFSADDYLGEANIPLEPLFAEGELPPTSYNVIKEGAYCGEVRVALTFTPERTRGFPDEEESFGGWRQSSMD
ncbi:c-5 sterol desaturase [Ancistrocladus abbreviatus]